jgi:hypothetical protein
MDMNCVRVDRKGLIARLAAPTCANDKRLIILRKQDLSSARHVVSLALQG